MQRKETCERAQVCLTIFYPFVNLSLRSMISRKAFVQNKQKKTSFPDSHKAHWSVPEKQVPTGHLAFGWSPAQPPALLQGTGSTGIQCVQSRSSHETLLSAPVHDRILRVSSSPSSLMSSPSSNDGKTVELFLGRRHSHNVLLQSSLVLLLPLGSAEETESNLALGAQHQSVCTTPGRSSVPNKENQVWSEKKKGMRTGERRAARERHEGETVKGMQHRSLSIALQTEKEISQFNIREFNPVILGIQIFLGTVYLSGSLKLSKANDFNTSSTKPSRGKYWVIFWSLHTAVISPQGSCSGI